MQCPTCSSIFRKMRCSALYSSLHSRKQVEVPYRLFYIQTNEMWCPIYSTTFKKTRCSALQTSPNSRKQDEVPYSLPSRKQDAPPYRLSYIQKNQMYCPTCPTTRIKQENMLENVPSTMILEQKNKLMPSRCPCYFPPTACKTCCFYFLALPLRQPVSTPSSTCTQSVCMRGL